ncbi:hypothetical protein LTR70_005984 [Exophiala xenobiotica]|uniref:Uncharacterized protein n=1 Tax=Lithohypha guttulata TaxID=1690604 RepID=A0ABR0JY34_9EURO|nr:hypothetical protein LTR24_009056 [Lithohypha guttulata]KAK5317244.1 hypothetical protein LTR70_005984 [Exophiala xenobiotica]
MLTLSSAFDVVGLLGRNIKSINNIISLTHDLDSSRNYPKKILYPKEFFPHSNPTHQAMVNEYVAVLEAFLGVKKTEFSLVERWAQYPPPEAEGKSLKDYLNKAAFAIQCHDYYQIFKPYREQYRNNFDKAPYAGPIVEFRWYLNNALQHKIARADDCGRSTGESVTVEEAAEHHDQLRVFREWFNSNVMGAKGDLLSDAIMILPYGGPRPKYRDAPNEPPSGSNTIGEKFMSPILQAPQLVLPSVSPNLVSQVSN